MNMKKKNNIEWQPDETYSDYKRRKHSGWSGTGQPNSQTAERGKCSKTNIEKYKCKCRACINRRNQAKGRRKQNLAKKKLGIEANRYGSRDAHEENWMTGLRVEVKSGKQVNPLATVFYKSKQQSDASHKAIGTGSKPFIQVSMPDNSTKGIVSFEIDEVENVAVEILKNFGYEFGD